jgi:hypothetical protein
MTHYRKLKIGDEVALSEDIENGRTIYCEKGETGTVTEISDEFVFVKMDRHFPEIDEWDNQLQIWLEFYPDALELIPR